MAENSKSEVQLTGILAEFRTALHEEIAAARRAATNAAIQLVNGRRIAQVGSGYQYSFSLENVLNLPGDAPGDLHVPGHAPLEIAVVSVDGMTVTLSVPLDLGPFVPTARLLTDLTMLMRRLIERIEDRSDHPNPVGERVRGAGNVGGRPIDGDVVGLNVQQNEAVGSALGRDLTYIWGPPGTGKTATIGAIGERLYDAGRSTLLVSHTNTAVDQAVLRIAEMLDDGVLGSGVVVRVGEPHDQRVLSYPDLLLETHVAKRSGELTSQREQLVRELSANEEAVADLQRTVALWEWTNSAEEDLISMHHRLGECRVLEQRLAEARIRLEEARREEAFWRSATDALEAAKADEDQLSDLEGRMSIQRAEAARAELSRETAAARLAEAQALYEATTSVGGLVRRWRRLPQPEEQALVVDQARGQLEAAQETFDATTLELQRLRERRNAVADRLAEFKRRFGKAPAEVAVDADSFSRRLQEKAQLVQTLVGDLETKQGALEDLVTSRLRTLHDWALADSEAAGIEAMLAEIRVAYERARAEIRGVDIETVQRDMRQLVTAIQDLQAEIEAIDDLLKRVEELVIADATVVATTLTRAYLRDAIQQRTFDTVVLDEASMAPIPALWIAAALAERNAVVVGDFRQLPPIVVSSHALAQRWLGRDIFEVAGIGSPATAPAHFVTLRRQYRMHPSISSISNELIYDGLLVDDNAALSDSGLSAWYDADWGYDEPVLLVDTSEVGAWVTSVPRARGSSRLNFLSATICVDIAEMVLHAGRPELQAGERARILIVCPYRPHARLLQLLLREQDLHNDVAAGTAHSFQGSEADLVILDLVNDEPHWRVGLFMPDNDDSSRRLFNVAITRARRRLIVVGDLDYNQKRARKAFLGGQLVPLLRDRYPAVDARTVIPAGLSARAARAQSQVFGGPIDVDAGRVVVDPADFFRLLSEDLRTARRRIVVYSPFMTTQRVGLLEPHLREAVQRGVELFVVTKPLEERGKRQQDGYRTIEAALRRWGASVIHKRGMHEKLVFVDDDVIWSGSLNPLSYSDTAEVMERRVSPRVVADYARTIRLDELVGEYAGGSPRCPICGSEITASEGPSDPYFWRCVEADCYTRSIDDPPLRDGEITCSSCGGAVEFGAWGDRPAWRCLDNRRHRQWVAKSHLRLPKMRDRIPRAALRNLERRFGL